MGHERSGADRFSCLSAARAADASRGAGSAVIRCPAFASSLSHRRTCSNASLFPLAFSPPLSLHRFRHLEGGALVTTWLTSRPPTPPPPAPLLIARLQAPLTTGFTASIRRATQRDACGVANVFVDAFPTVYPRALRYPFVWWDTWRKLGSDRVIVYVATETTEWTAVGHTHHCTNVVGSVDVLMMLSPLPITFGPAVMQPYIGNLAVLRSRRRRGLATSLMRTCEQHAINDGHGEIYLSVDQANEAAMRMYENLGYNAEVRDIQRYDPELRIVQQLSLFRKRLPMVE